MVKRGGGKRASPFYFHIVRKIVRFTFTYLIQKGCQET